MYRSYFYPMKFPPNVDFLKFNKVVDSRRCRICNGPTFEYNWAYYPLNNEFLLLQLKFKENNFKFQQFL